MLFNELTFAPFFLVVFLLCYITNRFNQLKLRNTLLLIASYYFYAYFSVTFLITLVGVTLINYLASVMLFKQKRKWVVSSAVLLSLLPLIGYKYTNFLLEHILMIHHAEWSHWVMPVGISFFTFQALTYTIDIYRDKITGRSSLLDYALFVSFFPTILSGPIARARYLLPQLTAKTNMNPTGLTSGFQLFLWGLFKKIVIADRMNVYTGSVFSTPDFYTGNTNLLAIALYSIQLYCDFSGYSDMAISVARMLGFKIRANFLFPFFSTSLRSFWRKWHISLTSWFTEYLYIACGGSRVSKWRWYFNLALVFIVSGIWHGAAWTYIVWGVLHAALYLIEVITKQGQVEPKTKIEATMRGLLIFILWAITLTVFRAETLMDAWTMLAHVLSPWGILYTGASLMSFTLLLCGTLLFVVAEVLVYRNKIAIVEDYSNPYSTMNLTFMVLAVLAISLLGQSGAQFVYFKF